MLIDEPSFSEFLIQSKKLINDSGKELIQIRNQIGKDIEESNSKINELILKIDQASTQSETIRKNLEENEKKVEDALLENEEKLKIRLSEISKMKEKVDREFQDIEEKIEKQAHSIRNYENVFKQINENIESSRVAEYFDLIKESKGLNLEFKKNINFVNEYRLEDKLMRMDNKSILMQKIVKDFDEKHRESELKKLKNTSALHRFLISFNFLAFFSIFYILLKKNHIDKYLKLEKLENIIKININKDILDIQPMIFVFLVLFAYLCWSFLKYLYVRIKNR